MPQSLNEPELPLRRVAAVEAEPQSGRPAPPRTRQLAERLLCRDDGGGRYRLVRELARGGMGIISIVEDRDLGRISAMKVIPSQIVDQDTKFQRFVGEARITAQLEHPNIIPVHEIGLLEDSGCLFYTMKKVEGESMASIIAHLAAGDSDYHVRYDRYRLLSVFRRVCDAVAYAHSRGIIHRDLKPENIMVGRFGEVLLMDWGLAKRQSEDEPPPPRVEVDEPPSEAEDGRIDATLTEDGIIKGSLAYLSPEQAFGDIDEIDTRTDVFLLGATLYHMFTYHPPYEGRDLTETISKAERCDLLPPSERSPEAHIPGALERIIVKAMAPLKDSRYASVEELSGEIDAFVAGRRVCDREVYGAGEDIITGGDVGTETYIITSGSVEVHGVLHGHRLTIATLGPGDIVGEMASISHSVRSATVTARETTEVLVITSDLMREELEKLPPWMEKIIFTMADRVRLLDRLVHPFIADRSVYPIVSQVYHILLDPHLGKTTTGRITTGVEDVIEELYVTLGLGRSVTEILLKVLLASGLLRREEGTGISIADMEEFEQFLDYCRVSLNVAGGTRRLQAVKLKPARQSYFRGILRKLGEAATKGPKPLFW